MRSLILIGVFAIAAAACSSFIGPSERSKLNAAREAWEAAGIDDYDFRVDHHCFCGIWPYRAVVEVRDGVIESVLDADTGQPPEQSWGIPAIPGLFERIEQALANGADEVNVTYDAEWGYPTYIQIDYYRQAVDDEFEIWVKDFALVLPADGAVEIAE